MNFTLEIGEDVFEVKNWEGTNFYCEGNVIIVVLEKRGGNDFTSLNEDEDLFCYASDLTFEPKQWNIVAHSGNMNLIIDPSHLADFFQMFKNITWITPAADKIFAVLFQSLKYYNPDKIDDLWEFVEEGKLRDIEVLGNLYYLIEDKYQQKSIANLIHHTTNVNLTPQIKKYTKEIKRIQKTKEEEEKLDEQIEENLNKSIQILENKILICIAIGIKYTWNILEKLTDKIMKIFSEDMYENSKEKFGYLTDLIQVKSKISLLYTHIRGIKIDNEKLDQNINQLVNKIKYTAREVSKILPYSRNLFQVGIDGEFISNEDDIPIIDKLRLLEILFLIQSELKLDENLSFECILNVKKFYKSGHQINLRQWEIYRKNHRFLDKWLDFEHLKTTFEYVKNINKFGPIAHPKWNYFQKNGRVSCQQPNIQITPRDADIRSIFTGTYILSSLSKLKILFLRLQITFILFF